MEQAEIEMLVGELEGRIDRLRSLYDMYFMGIERLEPLVPRKDVERRMAALRKEQIRNTGLRFKFNVIIQRFNTYQTYWLRIARQIEQGTYRRDVMRAQARFGVDPTKEVRTAEEPKAAPRTGVARPPEPESLEELEDGSAYLLPLDADDDPFADISISPPAPAAAAASPRDRFGSTVRLDLDDLGDPFEEHDPFPKPATPSLGPKMRIAPRPGAPSVSGIPGKDDGRGTAEPRIPAMPAPRIALRASGAPQPGQPAQTSAAPPPPGRGNEPRVTISKRASVPDELERVPSVRPVASSTPSIPALQRPATLHGTGPTITRISAAPPLPGASVAPPGPAPGLSADARARAPVPSRAPAPPPASAPRLPPPLVTRAPPSAPRAPMPTLPAAAAPPPVAPPPSSPVARYAPATAPVPVAARASPQPPPRPAVVGDLSGDRFGEIYAKYVETRRERNEPTHAITREALAKQLGESTERLKQKHGGKPIDFEVVVKDGKTILRPVVK